MADRYWTALFDYSTWCNRLPDRLTWGNRPKLVESLAPGDLVFCYVSRVGWVAVARCTSRARVDPAESPYGDEYPVIADVEYLLEVPAEAALAPKDLPSPDPVLRQSATGTALPFLFQSAGIEIPPEKGDRLLEILREWARAPVERPLSPRQTSYSARAELVETPSGTVAVPQDDPEDNGDALNVSESVSAHIAAQRKLLSLGHRLGYTPWVTPDDQSRIATTDGQTLAALPGVTTALPEQFNTATNRTIRHIDVMWLDRARITAAFEVENTTSIHSGLLRMADLVALQPNLDIPLYLVIPPERLDKAVTELLRPVFQEMQRPLSQMCRILTYEALDDLIDLAERAGGALRPEAVGNHAVVAGE